MKNNIQWLEEIKNEFYPDTNFNNRDGITFARLISEKNSKKYSVKQIDSHGGEGFGNNYWKVFKVEVLETSEIIYLKFEGEFNSWEGVEWSDVATLVTPKQKIVTFYE
jgi:hypothetical protein